MAFNHIFAEKSPVCLPLRWIGTDGMAVDDDDVEGDAALHRELRAQHKQQQLQDEEEYPDEVDVPTDVPGRVRFQKYRWVGNHGRATPEHWLWDQYGNLQGYGDLPDPTGTGSPLFSSPAPGPPRYFHAPTSSQRFYYLPPKVPHAAGPLRCTPHPHTYTLTCTPRGLKSFRSSPWDAKEWLPREYSSVFAFENFKRAQKRARAAVERATADLDPCAVAPGVCVWWEHVLGLWAVDVV